MQHLRGPFFFVEIGQKLAENEQKVYEIGEKLATEIEKVANKSEKLATLMARDSIGWVFDIVIILLVQASTIAKNNFGPNEKNCSKNLEISRGGGYYICSSFFTKRPNQTARALPDAASLPNSKAAACTTDYISTEPTHPNYVHPQRLLANPTFHSFWDFLRTFLSF